jgi:hypothetical protein
VVKKTVLTRSAAVALLRLPLLILYSKIILQFAILELNNVPLPKNLPNANKRNLYLCALCVFALKKMPSLFFSS